MKFSIFAPKYYAPYSCLIERCIDTVAFMLELRKQEPMAKDKSARSKVKMRH